MQNVRQERLRLRDNCQKLAEKNLQDAKELAKVQEEVEGLQARVNERIQHLMASADRKRQVASNFSTDAALKILQQRKEEADIRSVEMTDHFMDTPDADHNEFCKAYLAARTAYHVSNGMFELLSRK